MECVGRTASVRCHWAPTGDQLYLAYHDEEWGVPSRDDRHLFEMLLLEGAQAGLSWATILHKREAYRRAFEGFDPQLIARYGEADIARLLADAGIVRNQLKISAAIANARAFLGLLERESSLADFLWKFVDGQPRQNHWRDPNDIPASTPESARMSRALKERGFKFVGPTICYAFMQATGLVNDHITACFRHAELS